MSIDKIKEKPPVKASAKEKTIAAPKELVRRGLDDGTERLRGQLRDAAQGGRSGEDYGGDRIEDTAADAPRQVIRGTERVIRQLQHEREKTQDRIADIHYPQPEEMVTEQPLDISPSVGDSKPVVQDFPAAGPQPRESSQTPPVRTREPVAHQATVDRPAVKEKAEQVSVSQKPAATARVSIDGPAVKTKEKQLATALQKESPSLQRPQIQPPASPYQKLEPGPPANVFPDVSDSVDVVRDVPPVDLHPRAGDQPPSVRAREPAAHQISAEHPVIKENTVHSSISEKPLTSARVRMDGPSIKTKQDSIAQDFHPASKREPKPSPGKRDSIIETEIGTGTPLSTAPSNTASPDKPVVSHLVRTQTPDIKIHELVADIKTRLDITQIPIKTRESSGTVKTPIQLSGDDPALLKDVPSVRAGTPSECRNTMLPLSKNTKPYPRQTVRETAPYPAGVDTPAVHRSDKKRILSGNNRAGRNPAKVKERLPSSSIQPRIKGKRSTIKVAGRSARQKIKTVERTGRTTVKAAGRTARMPRQIQRTRQAVRSVETAVRRTAETIGKALKAAGVALQELMAAAVAGGGIAIAVVLMICLAGSLLASPLGMFFSGESNLGLTIQDTIVQVNGDFTNRIEQIKEENSYDVLDLDNAGVTAALSNWRDILAVYAVRITTDSTNPGEVFTLTPEKQAVLRETFWDMSALLDETQTVSGASTLKIAVTVKNAQQMADEYGFNADQRKLLEEMLSPAYQEFFQGLTGNFRNITLTPEQIQQIADNLPASLSTQRKQVIFTAYQLLGKVNYFWGGKSLVLGWDSRWGIPREVTAAGSPSSGTIRPYGLDCSGFVDWVFYNVSNGGYVIGHGGGARMQHTYCRNISWNQAIPGDLVFYPEDTHVGIVCGFDENGNVLIIHCASGANNVVVTGRSGFTSIARPNYYSE